MWITPLWKFLLSFIAISAVNSNIGYMAAIRPTPIVVMCALLCSFMPVNFMVFVTSIFVLAHIYAISIETLGVTLVLFLLMFLLYFRFGPGDTVVLILTPLLFMLGIPYLMPIALGLLAGPMSIGALSCGIVVHYLLVYVKANATTMGVNSVANGEDTEIIVQLRTFLSGFLTNKVMWIMIVGFAAVLFIVWLLRRLPVDHSWKIAIIGGAVTNLVILMAGDFKYDIQLPFSGVVIGTVFSALLCFVLEFFFFQLDYSRTERVQFEDDDYYYYVKAVPKVTLAEPEHKVKKINRTHHVDRRPPSRQAPRSSRPSPSRGGGTAERRQSAASDERRMSPGSDSLDEVSEMEDRVYRVGSAAGSARPGSGNGRKYPDR